MKKTLVALAVAAAAVASTANAVEVYKNEGTTVELGGSFRAFLGKVADKRADLKNDGSRIELNANQDLSNGLSAFVGYRLEFGDNFGGEVKTTRLFAGIKHDDVGSLSFGRQATNADDVVADGAYYRSGEFNPLKTSHDKTIKFRSAEFAGLSFGADYLFGNSSKDSDGFKNGFGAGAFYDYAIDSEQKLSLAAGYTQKNQEVGGDTSQKDRAWVFRAGYTYGPLSLVANYGRTKVTYDYDLDATKIGNDEKGTYTMLEAKYQVAEPTSVWAQWERASSRLESSDVTDEIKNRYQVGADYQLHKNVVTYALYEHVRTKDADNDKTRENIYGVGLRVFF